MTILWVPKCIKYSPYIPKVSSRHLKLFTQELDVEWKLIGSTGYVT